MSDDRRRFALIEEGEEASVFRGNAPRQAALKAARRLDPAENEESATASSERIRLREHGTIKIHVYEAWTWQERTTQDDPEWLGDNVTRANVRKVRVETVTKAEKEFDYRRIAPLISDQPIRITQEKCHKCGSSLEDGFKIAVGVKDVPDPPIVRHSRYYYECDNCDEEVVAHKKDFPSRGRYGTNLLAQAVLFRYEYRIPYRKVSSLFEQMYGCSISEAGVLHLCERMATTARSEYEAIQKQIQSADVLFADETPHLVDGSKSWLWVFTTGNRTFYAFRDSRGSKVLEDVLGDRFSGVIVCDGHRSYPAYHSWLQRCWTHLLRGTDSLSDDDTEAWSIYNLLFDIFDGLKSFLQTDPTPVQRLVVQSNARNELERLARTEVQSEDADDVLTMLENGIGHWLTFVVHPDVEPTNNTAEAILREPIAMRRIIRTLQNQKGMRLHETFLTLLKTWKQQGANPYAELQRLARKV
jgi:transposase